MSFLCVSYFPVGDVTAARHLFEATASLFTSFTEWATYRDLAIDDDLLSEADFDRISL